MQIYNIFEVPKLVDYCSTNNLDIYFDLVHEPEFLSLQALPQSLAIAATKELEKVATPGVNVEHLISALDSWSEPRFFGHGLKVHGLLILDRALHAKG